MNIPFSSKLGTERLHRHFILRLSSTRQFLSDLIDFFVWKGWLKSQIAIKKKSH